MTIGQKEGKHFWRYDNRTNDNWPKRTQNLLALRLSDKRQLAE
jgi:hypothetical protein